MGRLVVIANASDWGEGSMAPVEIEGRRIALCKIEGEFHAFDDHCPHAGSTLALGTMHEGNVECPRHEFVWRIASGQSLSNSDDLVMLNVRVEGDDVVLDMPDPWPEPAHLKRHPNREELRKKLGYGD
jgi:nitrite reductase/ring-hydroxylating ferredoxin subunit